MLTRQYIPPEPYLKMRFENFLKLPTDQKTNQEVYRDFKKDQSLEFPASKDAVHINGWSFALTQQVQNTYDGKCKQPDSNAEINATP
jgi:hypothetical protein